MLIPKCDITLYIPQRPPMVMVDELVRAEADLAVTRFTILRDNLFLVSNRLGEPGLVENIAQTIAAMVGYNCFLKNIPVPIGYIAAVKDLKIASLPVEGSVIETTVMITNQVMDVTVVKGKVEQAGNVICSCEMKVVAKA
jgi:3-hydroxyacyl-[acyl-carrier-protein] dehydratase